ncbi:MAG: hypothetical protein ACFFDB_06465 [Promethearchaeota archaeon]
MEIKILKRPPVCAKPTIPIVEGITFIIKIIIEINASVLPKGRLVP